jgi:cytochrome P450
MTTDAVHDWASDYYIFDPDYIKDPFPIWKDIRGKCPVAHTERIGGSWMPINYEDLVNIAANTDVFSSANPLVVPLEPPEGHELAEANEEDQPFYGVGAPPISSDPPEHTWSRRLILPPFSARAIEKWVPMTEEHCNSLIDGFIDKGGCDGAADYAQQIPPYVIARMLGIPVEMTDTFTQWVREFLEFGLQNFDMAVNSRNTILTFLWQQLQERKKDASGDDLISYLLRAEVDGKPVPDQHVLGTSFLLLLAGIDTTWSSIGAALWHLAQHPEDRRRMMEDPEVFTTGIDELLRAYAPVTMARIVTRDFEYDGCKMKAGDKVLMSFPAGNRDPAKFENPDEVQIDRKVNPHIAFGVGIHRCAGSNLARMEMRVAIKEFLTRIPDFRLEDPEAVTWAGGQVRGPRSMRLAFD